MSSVAFSAAHAMYQDRLRDSAVRNRRGRSRQGALRRFLDRRGAIARPVMRTNPDGAIR